MQMHVNQLMCCLITVLSLCCLVICEDYVLQPVGLGKIAKLINAGKIDSSELITMKTLKVKLLS